MRVVIAGAGEVGQHLAMRLSHGRDDVVLIDEDADLLQQIEEGLDVQVLQGDVASRAVLRRAEVGKAEAFIAVSGSGDANVLAAALGRAMGARVAVAGVDDPHFYEVPGCAERGVLGIDHVLCRTRLTASEILTHMARGTAPFAHTFLAGALQVALLRVDPGHASVGRRPSDLGLAQGAVLGGVAREVFLRRPEEVARIEPGDHLLVAGPPQAIAASSARLSGARSERHVVIGGSEVGAIVAHELAGRRHRTDLVEADKRRCVELAAKYPQVNVLHGDPTDLDFLRDIRSEEADSVVAVTQQEEVNLLTTLLVRELDRVAGAVPHTFVAVHRPGYGDLCRRMGIEGIASSFEVLSRAILEAITPSGVVCHEALPGLAWTIVHARFGKGVRADATLADVPLPTGTLLLAHAREGTPGAPDPGSALGPGDEVLVACPARDVQEVERAVRRAGAA